MIHTHDLFSYFRNDGRKADEFRDFSITVGKVGESMGELQSSIFHSGSSNLSISSPSFGVPDGIASIQSGDACVVATVYGPRQAENTGPNVSTKASISVELSVSQFASEKSRNSTTDASLNLLSMNIQNILESLIQTEKFPGSEILCSVVFLRDDGSRFSLAFNAIMAAIVHAGIPILDTAVAVNVIFHSNQIFIDPTASETISVYPEMRLVSLSSSKRIIGIVHTGKCTTELFKKLMAASLDASEIYSKSMRKILMEALKQLVSQVS